MSREEIKAKELVDKFRNEFKWVEKDYPIDLYRDTRQCALIAADEIIIALKFTNDSKYYVEQNKYWESIKYEINKL